MFYKYFHVFLPGLLGAAGLTSNVVNASPEGIARHCLQVCHRCDEEFDAGTMRVGLGASAFRNNLLCWGSSGKWEGQLLQEGREAKNDTSEYREDRKGQVETEYEPRHHRRLAGDGWPATTRSGSDGPDMPEIGDAMVLMQRKRGRPASPRRRRRARATRQAERQRQENRHSWSVDAGHTRARTATCSRRIWCRLGREEPGRKQARRGRQQLRPQWLLEQRRVQWPAESPTFRHSEREQGTSCGGVKCWVYKIPCLRTIVCWRMRQ